MIRIGIVDDKLANRKILREKLERDGRMKIVLEATDGKRFLDEMESLDRDKRPMIVLMDLEMPGMDGIAAIAAGSSLYPELRFVVVTIFDDDEKIFNAIRSGAVGYLLKEEHAIQLNEAMVNLYENGAGPISPSIAFRILQMIQGSTGQQMSIDPFSLSDREKEILQLLSEGLEYKEIALRTMISANTVKKHCINIYQKLHASGRAQALTIAYKNNLLR